MSNPLNPDGIEAGAKALRDDHANRTEHYVVPEWEKTPHGSKELFRAKANVAVSAYFAVAQPEVSTVEELDALPDYSVVLSGAGTVLYKWSEVRWYSTNDHSGYYLNVDIDLPARVLHRPEVNDA